MLRNTARSGNINSKYDEKFFSCTIFLFYFYLLGQDSAIGPRSLFRIMKAPGGRYIAATTSSTTLSSFYDTIGNPEGGQSWQMLTSTSTSTSTLQLWFSFQIIFLHNSSSVSFFWYTLVAYISTCNIYSFLTFFSFLNY